MSYKCYSLLTNHWTFTSFLFCTAVSFFLFLLETVEILLGIHPYILFYHAYHFEHIGVCRANFLDCLYIYIYADGMPKNSIKFGFVFACGKLYSPMSVFPTFTLGSIFSTQSRRSSSRDVEWRFFCATRSIDLLFNVDSNADLRGKVHICANESMSLIFYFHFQFYSSACFLK